MKPTHKQQIVKTYIGINLQSPNHVSVAPLTISLYRQLPQFKTGTQTIDFIINIFIIFLLISLR